MVIHNKLSLQLEIRDLLRVNFKVERKIKLVTFIARNYEVGHPSDRFEQEMSNAIFSQQIMPQFENKDDYVSHLVSANQEDEEDNN